MKTCICGSVVAKKTVVVFTNGLLFAKGTFENTKLAFAFSLVHVLRFSLS